MTLRNVLEILIRRLINNYQIYSLQGIVKSIDETKRTCSVVVDDTTYSDVLLQAVNTYAKGLVLIPAVDSVVTITFKSKETAFVSQFTELTKIIVEASTGIKLINGSSGLKTTLKNIVNELIAFKTVSPGGDGSTDPTTITNLQTYLKDLDNYLID
jgi:hypothetical protein